MKNTSLCSKGFSLLELMIVIAIIAIFSAFAVPNTINDIPKYNLGAGTRELLSAMQLARMTAIKENSNVVLSFNSVTRLLTIFVDDGEGGGTAEDKVRNGAERLVKSYQMPSGIELLTPSFGQAVQFNNRGIPDLNGDASLRNRLSKTKTVRLLASGHSRIQ
jgi:prepilin-type N-terminal cleavage/methylation domain-containing protein